MSALADMPDAPVTAIVCCFNASETIVATLDSLLGQTYPELEILVIDDGSTDGSADLLRALASREPRLRLFENPRNCGTAYSRQRGLELTRTELVLFLDSDDIAMPELVASQARLMSADRGLLGVGCHASYFGGDGRDLGMQRLGPTSREQALAHYNDNKMMFMAGVTMFRREDALEVGGYRRDIMPNPEFIRYEDFSEDVDLWCRLSDKGAEGRYFLTIPRILFRIRKPTNSLSTSNVRLMQLKMRWIKDCLVRRRSGLAERSLSEFVASRSWRDRFADRRSDAAAKFYKMAGFAYANRSYAKLCGYLLLTALTSPGLVRQKIRTQGIIR
jgi:glycosyltransferase involved in cell wall biosynthesis